jgi:hypothetical protein
VRESNTKIKYSVDTTEQGLPFYHFKVYTDLLDYAKISGHRFVKLVNENTMYNNDLDLILGFLKLQPPVESEYITCGNILEPKIVEFLQLSEELQDVKTFSFEDLENGTEDFHFIRDLEYTNEEGQSVTGEIKTFYNRKKLEWDGLIPAPHIDWWLQTRLELEVLKEEGGLGRIFYYYVTPSVRKKLIEGQPHDINLKYFFQSDYIVKPKKGEKEDMIASHFFEQGFTNFQELIEYALMRREDLMTLYEDSDGRYFQAHVPIKYPWSLDNTHIDKYIENLKNYYTIEEI